MTAVKINQAISSQFPAIAKLRLVAGQITDHLSELYPGERASIVKAIGKRQREFSTGRVLARQAMIELGLSPAAIERGENREPLWPGTVSGSITHAEDLAVAAVVKAGALKSVGIDLEIADRVGEELHRKLFTAGELKLLAHGDPRLAGLMFSAKESGYKATYPLAQRFIGFKEAEVRVDWPNQRFSFRYLGEHAPNRIMEQGEGHFLFCGRYVLSLFIIH